MQTDSSESDRESFRKEYLALATRFHAASDIHAVLPVILETEQLFRDRGQVGFGSASFNAEMAYCLPGIAKFARSFAIQPAPHHSWMRRYSICKVARLRLILPC